LAKYLYRSCPKCNDYLGVVIPQPPDSVQRLYCLGAKRLRDNSIDHEVWRDSEDSRQLNTSYIERLNLTIRQGSAYLCRRSLCHARRTKPLEDHLELLRCHYNFLRTHRALKFGHEVRTPAMQAGLTKKRLTFRDIFTSIPNVLRLVKVNYIVIRQVTSTAQQDFVTSMAA
jgi:hypothetical protein